MCRSFSLTWPHPWTGPLPGRSWSTWTSRCPVTRKILTRCSRPGICRSSPTWAWTRWTSGRSRATWMRSRTRWSSRSPSGLASGTRWSAHSMSSRAHSSGSPDDRGYLAAYVPAMREADSDPTAHAEIVVMRRAAARRGTWRLDGLTLVVTLEPCIMCAGAVTAARLDRLVYGAADPRSGAAGSVWDLLHDRRLGHEAEVLGGVLESECGDLLREFFRSRR